MSTKEEQRKLIDEAKAKLIETPKATKDSKFIEATDPALINALLAERDLLATQIKDLTARKAEIEAIFKDVIGDHLELRVHGAKVATYRKYRETVLKTDVVQEQFPLLDYPELYKRVNRTRLTIH